MNTQLLALVVFAFVTLSAAAQDAFVVRGCGWEPGSQRVCVVHEHADARARAPLTAEANRVENGAFEAGAAGGLRAWNPFSKLGGSGSLAWSSNDSGGLASSGSLSITNSGANPDPSPTAESWFGVSQCVRPGDVLTGQPYSNTEKYFIAPGQVSGASEALILFGAEYFVNGDCTGTRPGGPPGGFGGWPVSPQGTGGWVSGGPGSSTYFLGGYKSIRFVVAVVKENRVPAVTVLVDELAFRGPFGLVKGDLDGDGETDLLLRNDLTGLNQVWFMHDERRGTEPVSLWPSPPALDWRIAGVDDFDGDDLNDLLLWNQATGGAELWLMNGTSRIGAPLPLPAPGLPWKPSATADFDHDGSPDVVWRNSSTQKIQIWTMNGTAPAGTIVPSPDQAADPNWEIVAAQDVNGDAHVDLLWYNSTSGRVVQWWMNASVQRLFGSFTEPPQAADASWKVLAAGDFGIGPSGAAAGLADTTDLIWRNAASGRLVAWFMDKAGRRTAGLFVTPAPTPPATDWTVVGPR